MFTYAFHSVKCDFSYIESGFLTVEMVFHVAFLTFGYK